VGAGDDRLIHDAEQVVQQVVGLGRVPAVRVDRDDHGCDVIPYFGSTQIGLV
jgi:hypothetical protein